MIKLILNYVKLLRLVIVYLLLSKYKKRDDYSPCLLLDMFLSVCLLMSPLCSLPLSRTDALLVKLSLLVGQQVFYGALWGSMLVTPMVRLPASVFIVTHFDRMAPLSQQTHMLGYSHSGVVSCLSATVLRNL